MSETLQHLVLVRHGEAEGDLRRAAWKRGEAYAATKTPEQEELTVRGIEQSRKAGRWIQKNIIDAYRLDTFDGCYVSSTLRSEQSAVALDLPIAVWQADSCLDERNRGQIRGLQPGQHKQLFPDSYHMMKTDPLHWQPPGGETLATVAERVSQFLQNIAGSRTVLAVGHRDWCWVVPFAMGFIGFDELAAVNTDLIENGQVHHYTSLSPETGEDAGRISWFQSACPWRPPVAADWQHLPTVA